MYVHTWETEQHCHFLLSYPWWVNWWKDTAKFSALKINGAMLIYISCRLQIPKTLSINFLHNLSRIVLEMQPASNSTSCLCVENHLSVFKCKQIVKCSLQPRALELQICARVLLKQDLGGSIHLAHTFTQEDGLCTIKRTSFNDNNASSFFFWQKPCEPLSEELDHSQSHLNYIFASWINRMKLDWRSCLLADSNTFSAVSLIPKALGMKPASRIPGFALCQNYVPANVFSAALSFATNNAQTRKTNPFNILNSTLSIINCTIKKKKRRICSKYAASYLFAFNLES